ncbi:hypothetical protein D6D21_09949 [Aureobasidium pullulans]|uniref:F-box domain-containing protein n=1 Tax=Aureobasidium pullulans TaxID=5580 RepID=A0AB74IJ03_AURPU|nr:hypothetical protein D6D21_09949 [Aureobasidium pullulans]
MPLCPSSVDVVFSNRDIAITNLRLLSLPNEVLTMICTDDEISAKDMCAIRLTCKELRAIVEKDFAKRYFQDPFVMMTRESLQALVDICKHPVFGPHVRKVQLSNRRFNADLLPDLAEEMAEASIEGRQADNDMQLVRGKLQSLMDLVYARWTLTESGDALKLLTEAFKVLGRTEKPIALASQQHNLGSHPIGFTNSPFDVHPTDPNERTPTSAMYPTLEILLNAAQAGNCSVAELEVGVDCSTNYGTVLNPDEAESFQQFSKSLLVGVKEFRVGFEWQSQSGLQNFTTADYITSLLKCLPKDLKTFVLRSNLDVDATKNISYTEARLTQQCFSVIQVNNLESICLSKLCIREESLYRILNLSKKTLISLTLENISLIGDWDIVLSRIAASCCSLQQVSLDGAHKVLIDDHPPPYYHHLETVSKWYSSAIKFRGKDAFSLGLEDFIEHQDVERQEIARQIAERTKAEREERRLWRAEYGATAGKDPESEDEEQEEVERRESKREAARRRKEQRKQQESGRPLRRSKRLAGKKAAADQPDQPEQTEQAE